MTQRNLIGLGLNLPPGSSHTSPGSRRAHERSHSLHDPFHLHSESNTYGSIDYGPYPRPTYSGIQSLRYAESSHAKVDLDAAAAAVVGTLPKIRNAESSVQIRSLSSCSHETQVHRDSSDLALSHLKLARVRARSAPAIDPSKGSTDIGTHSNFPRGDSLLSLDSLTTSKDLKKLLTTRVRHALPSIDTEKANTTGISSSSDSPTKDGSQSCRLESEKSRSRVEVYVALNNHVAVEGGTISGTLTVHIRKPRRGEARRIRVDVGRIRVLGFEGISDAERCAFYQCSADLTEASTDCSELYRSGPDNDGFSAAREGTFSTPFTMHIPHADRLQPCKNVPKGVIQDNSVNAVIKYILLVSFKVKDDADNATGIDKNANLANSQVSIAHFYRNVELWPTYGPMALHSPEESHPALGHTGTVSSRTAQGLFFGGTGMLHLTAVLHRKIWIAGQKCMVYIGAWNETKKFVKTLTMSIVRKATVTRPNQSDHINRKQISEVSLDAVRGPSFGPVTGKGWWAGIEPGATCEFSHMIDIPPDALTVIKTHMIEVTYVLRVTLVTGSLSSNVSVDLPFNIVNAISTDGIPARPPPGLLVGGLKLPKDVPVSFAFESGHRNVAGALDLRTWSYPSRDSSEAAIPPQRDILDWTKHTAGSSSISDASPMFVQETTGAQHDLQSSSSANTSHQLYDEMPTEDPMSRLIDEVESDLRIQNHRSSHCSSRRNPSLNSGILKPSSMKHRVTFLTPSMSDTLTMDSSTPKHNIHDRLGLEYANSLEYPKRPSSGQLVLQDDGPVRVRIQPGDVVCRANDAQNDEDPEEILKSLRMDEEVFDSYLPSHGQEITMNDRNTGLSTGSSLSSDPWSASGKTSSLPSANCHTSNFETSSEQDYERSRLPSFEAISGLSHNSVLKDNTPRAGSVPRFLPEVNTGPIRTSSSRATLVPTISGPMLAKSLSAHIAGSPVNQYRKFSPQQVVVSDLGANAAKPKSIFRRPAQDPRAVDTEHTLRKPVREGGIATISGTSRDSIYFPPSSSGLTILPDTGAHLCSRSGPESRHTSNDVNTPESEVPSKSTVRSRIAELEERSRNRPVSDYSNTLSTSSIFLHK